MSRIASVSIRRFKSLEEVTIDLADTTLLIGANNSGKSSTLQAIHFAVSIAQSARLIGEGVTWRNDTFELSFNPSQLIYSPVADVLSLATGGTLQEQRPTQIQIEFLDDEGKRCTVGLRRGRNRNIAVSIVGRELGERLMNLENPFTVYAPGLAGVPKEERYLSPGVVRRIVARGDANLALRNVLRMLHANDNSWNLFIEDMQSIFSGISIEVVFEENTDENIQAQFQLPGGPLLPIDAAGTSILQASQILAYIALFKPQVLILDEPDSHLHPDNQRTLCDLVYRLASARGFQALISTHSRHVLDAMKGRTIVVWLSKGRIVEGPDLNTTSMLLDLGALDSVDYFADGQLRCVVATEDSIKEPLRAVLWSNGFVEDDTEVASYTGCTKSEAALVLGGFLREKAPHVRLVVHRDRDYMGEAAAQSFEQRLSRLGVFAFLTELNDIETYFLNPYHLNILNPTISVERIKELWDQATAETKNSSIEAIVNQRTIEAFRERREGGTQPNHGEIAVGAQTDYDADPVLMRRGSVVLPKLQTLLQQELGSNPRVFFPSNFLRSDVLRKIATEIWPTPIPAVDEQIPMPTPE
jgi:energy-coupling factor transporter ATP-binding protein EcfA2